MPRRKKATMGKSEFVRSMSGRPAQDIVDAAAKQAMKLSTRYVYVIRSSDKRKGLGGAAATGRRGPRGGAGADANLRRAIAELGLARARAVLADVQRAFGGQ